MANNQSILSDDIPFVGLIQCPNSIIKIWILIIVYILQNHIILATLKRVMVATRLTSG